MKYTSILSNVWLQSICYPWDYLFSYQKELDRIIASNCKLNFSINVFILHAVHSLQVELGELKGRLTEVISNCDALCKRIAADGPESLKSTVKPFLLAPSETSTSSAETVRTEPQLMQKPT